MAQGITGSVKTSSPAEVGLFQARLDYATTTTVKLNPFAGALIEIDNRLINVVASLTLNTTDNLIDGSGFSAGAAMTGNAGYYAYISNDKAIYSVASLRASTVAPTLLDGVLYLGTSGNARNWRFVGWVRANNSTQFADSDISRLVVSYYNRKLAKLFSCPAYSDGNSITTYVDTGSSWAEANGGVGSRFEYIGNGEDAVTYSAYAVGRNSNSARGNAIAIGIEDDNQVKVEAYKELQAVANSVGNLACSYCELVAAGVLRTVTFLIRRVTGITATFEADGARNGGSVDPYKTYIEAEVMV